MFARQLIADLAPTPAGAEPPAPLVEAGRVLQLLEDLGGWAQWKVVFPGSAILSRPLCRMFGMAPTDDPMPLEAMIQLYHPEDRGRLLGLIARCLESRRGFHGRLRLLRADGAVRMIETLADLRVKDGRVTELFGVSRDVTPAATEEAQALARARLLQEMVSAMPAPVVLLDERLRVLECSLFWLKSHRFIERNEVIGRGLYQLFPDMPDAVRKEHERALRGETVRTRRTFTNPSTNTPMQCNAVVAPWYVGDNQVGGLAIMVGWGEFGISRPRVGGEPVPDFDGSLLDMLKTVI